jgi:hypothetical protein
MKISHSQRVLYHVFTGILPHHHLSIEPGNVSTTPTLARGHPLRLQHESFYISNYPALPQPRLTTRHPLSVSNAGVHHLRAKQVLENAPNCGLYAKELLGLQLGATLKVGEHDTPWLHV